MLLLALLAVANATTLASWNQTILPLPHGGSFATAASGEKDPSVISYYIATNNFTIDEDGDTKPDLKVTARVFLGNHTYAEVRLHFRVNSVLCYLRIHLEAINTSTLWRLAQKLLTLAFSVSLISFAPSRL